MELKAKPRSRTAARLHFAVRFLLLTAVLALGVGAVLAVAWDTVLPRTVEELRPFWEQLLSGTAEVPVWLLAVGLAVAVLCLLIEFLIGLRFVAGRRSVFGVNAMLQVGLAAVLLVGINLWSFSNYWRLDWTWPQPQPEIAEGAEPEPAVGKFTLPVKVREQLADLRGETTIVVYNRHRTFGQLSDKPDPEDLAAASKVVEKVQDLVDLFREEGRQAARREARNRAIDPAAGPWEWLATVWENVAGGQESKFRVVVLDVNDRNTFKQKLADETKDRPELKAAIDRAPVNSIFFVSKGQGGKDTVQRLTFNEFYQLDKKASLERGNLVLLNQGVEPFARRILNADEKKPRIAIGTIHDLLSTEGNGDYGLRGLKKTLESYGFETEDVILKRSRGFQLLGAGAYTFAESRYDRLENEIKILDVQVRNLEALVQRNEEMHKEWKDAKLKDLTEKYARRLRVKEIDEDMRKFQLAGFAAYQDDQKKDLEEYRRERDRRVADRGKLNVDDATELQRMTDLEAKMDRILADCDMLLLPRMTFRNLNLLDVINPSIYRLEDAQAAAIKKFLKNGKPVLVCFGPTNEPPRARMDPESSGPDPAEKLLSELGVQLGKTVVLYDAEAASFAGQGADQAQVLGANVSVPPVEFGDWGKGDAWPLKKPDAPQLAPNPIRRSMVLAENSIAKPLDLPVRYPRPVYFEPTDGRTPKFDPEILMTSASAWNEAQPFATEERTPRFEEPKSDDAAGTRDEKRHGRFSIGVAVEAPLPGSWFASGEKNPGDVRLVVYGQGGAAQNQGSLITGDQLTPAQEKLLLTTCNWLLGRDDRLPNDDRPWEFPRVPLDSSKIFLWQTAALVGLPALFLYLGLVVLMVRRMR